MLASACNTSKKASGQNDKPLVTFQKTACFGICPVYSMEIFNNGSAAFKGEKNTTKIGNYKKKLSRKEIKILIGEFEKAGFFDLQDEYTEKITDLPTTYTSFNYKGKYKKIRNYHGAPDALKNLEKVIEKIVDSEGWKKT